MPPVPCPPELPFPPDTKPSGRGRSGPLPSLSRPILSFFFQKGGGGQPPATTPNKKNPLPPCRGNASQKRWATGLEAFAASSLRVLVRCVPKAAARNQPEAARQPETSLRHPEISQRQPETHQRRPETSQRQPGSQKPARGTQKLAGGSQKPARGSQAASLV